MKVLVLYYTKTGHTLEAVTAVMAGVRAAGSTADQVEASELDPQTIGAYDALIVGSPCWAGIAGAGVAIPISRAIAHLDAEALAGKRCGAVSVHSGMGGESAIKNLGTLLQDKGCVDFRPGPAARAGTPFSAWVGPAVRPEDKARFQAFGRAFVAP